MVIICLCLVTAIDVKMLSPRTTKRFDNFLQNIHSKCLKRDVLRTRYTLAMGLPNHVFIVAVQGEIWGLNDSFVYIIPLPFLQLLLAG